MANSWFRLYAEFAHDAKVQMMSECEQRRLVMLFCIRCNGDVTLQDEEVAFQLRISNEEWQATKALFVSRGFINSDNEVLNWDKRQFVSDSSAERVARHRNKKKQEGNVTVTPPDTDTDTEQIHKKQARKPSKSKPELSYDQYPEFLEFWTAYPNKEGKYKALEAWAEKNPPIDRVLAAIAWQIHTDKWRKDNGQYIPLPTTYINGKRWEDERPQEVTF